MSLPLARRESKRLRARVARSLGREVWLEGDGMVDGGGADVKALKRAIVFCLGRCGGKPRLPGCLCCSMVHGRRPTQNCRRSA